MPRAPQVVSEADAVFGRDNGPETALPASAELNNLAFTQCCLKEALRKYSVVPIVVREAVRDVTIANKYFVPAGETDRLLLFSTSLRRLQHGNCR